MWRYLCHRRLTVLKGTFLEHPQPSCSIIDLDGSFSYLHSLNLWRLNDRGLGGLDHTVHLDRLAVGKLHQCYCGITGGNLGRCYRRLEHTATPSAGRQADFIVQVVSKNHRGFTWARVMCWASDSATAVSPLCCVSAPASMISQSLQTAGNKLSVHLLRDTRRRITSTTCSYTHTPQHTPLLIF